MLTVSLLFNLLDMMDIFRLLILFGSLISHVNIGCWRFFGLNFSCLFNHLLKTI